MTTTHLRVVLAIGAWLMAPLASAQTIRTEQIEAEKAAKAAEVRPEAREKGDLIITKIEQWLKPQPPAVRLTFGTFRPGAGFALGAASEVPVGERGLWTASAAASVNKFKMVETAVDIPPLSTDRVRLRGVARWEDAPDLRFFGVGLDSNPADEVGYGLRTSEAGGSVSARIVGRWLSVGGGVTDFRVTARDGTGSVPTVGVTASQAWWHSTAFAAFDSRHSPGYTTGGALYRVDFHDYADRDGASSFTRTEIDLRQFVPVLHDNWVIALQARADLSRAADGQSIPFFLLPSIGGRDTLPGFENYRFTDNNSLLLRSELRWTPGPLVDMALFLDQGTVGPTARGLDLRDLKRSWGIGARFHGPSFTALRLELVRSAEGWRYNIAQNVSF